MGAVLLTPGAAVVPATEDLVEQFEWLAQRIEEHGGEAWVLPVTDLSERDEAIIRERERAQRGQEYEALRVAADGVTRSARRKSARPPTRRKLLALERGFRSVQARDHFRAGGKASARQAIGEARRQAAP
jgi:flavin-dependent dehydrogenase